MENQSYNSFWQRIHESAKTKAFPLRVMFELTYRCNFRCRHCYVPYSYRKKRELKTKEVFSILKQLKDIGCFYLGFTGGEPFMRKDIIDILWHAKRKGFEIIIYTNGSLIDKRTADELSALKPNKVDITIPAMSKEALEKITQMRGSHKKIFSAIDFLHKREVSLGFKTCVLKENESQIKEIQDFAVSLCALHRLDDMLLRRLDGSEEPFNYRGRLKNDAVTNHKSQITSQGIIDGDLEDCNKKTMDYRLLTIDLFKCGVGKSQAAITPQGELKMCLMIDYPKYKIMDREVVSRMSYVVSGKPNLKQTWSRMKQFVASIRPDENYQCNNCNLYTYCKWCPGKGWLYNKSFTTCEPESRHWAELRALNWSECYDDKS